MKTFSSCLSASLAAWLARSSLVLLVGLCAGAHAAAAVSFAAPLANAAPSSSGGLFRVTLALILVLAAVLGAAWMARRVRGISGGPGTNLSIVAQLPLGTRERAVLIRVGSQQLLLGVAQGNVRTLLVLDAAADEILAQPTSAVAGAPQRPSFKSILLKSLGK